jgi:hypothetical protein
MTADVRRTPRRGTLSRMRPKRMHPSQARVIVACLGRRVLRSVLRPVHVSLAIQTRTVKRSWRGASLGITVGKTHASGRNQHWGRKGGRQRGSPRVTAPAREAAWRVRQGRRSRPPSREENESSGLVGRTSCSLQKSAGDVWSRISSANALQKERSGSSERGPSAERRLAGHTVGRRVERRDSRESTSPLRRSRIGARSRVA